MGGNDGGWETWVAPGGGDVAPGGGAPTPNPDLGLGALPRRNSTFDLDGILASEYFKELQADFEADAGIGGFIERSVSEVGAAPAAGSTAPSPTPWTDAVETAPAAGSTAPSATPWMDAVETAPAAGGTAPSATPWMDAVETARPAGGTAPSATPWMDALEAPALPGALSAAALAAPWLGSSPTGVAGGLQGSGGSGVGPHAGAGGLVRQQGGLIRMESSPAACLWGPAGTEELGMPPPEAAAPWMDGDAPWWGGRDGEAAERGDLPPPGPLRRASALARSKSDATGWLAGLGGLAGGAVTRAGSSKGKVYRAKQLNRTVSGGARKKPSSASPQRAPLARSKSDATGLLRGLGPARGPGAATGSPKGGGSRAKQLNRTVSGGPGKRKVSAAHRRSKSRDQVDAVVRPAAVTGAFSKEFWQWKKMLAGIQRGLRVRKQLLRPLQGLKALPLIQELRKSASSGGGQGTLCAPMPLPRGVQSSNRRYTGVEPARDTMATSRPLWEARIWVRACEAEEGAPGGTSLAWDPKMGTLPGGGGSDLHLGFFESPEHAAEQYDRAALFFRGPEARTNFESWSYMGEEEIGRMVAMGRSGCVAYFRRAYERSREGLGPGAAGHGAEAHQPGGGGEAPAAGTRTSRKSAATPARQLPPGTLKGLIRDKTSTKGAVEKGGGPTSASLSPGVHDDSSTRALPAPSGPVAASPADREKPDVPARHQSPSLQRTALGEIQAAVQTLRARSSTHLSNPGGEAILPDFPMMVSDASE